MTIRDTINRQKESREAAERAKQERFAKAEAEALAVKEAKIAATVKAEADAKARLKAKEDARLQAIADAKAQKIAEELAKAEAKAQAKAAIEAEAIALKQAKLQAKVDAKAQKLALKQAQIDSKLKAKADAKAQKLALKQAQIDAKFQAKADIEAKELAKQEASAKVESERQAIVLAKEKTKLEAEGLAKEKARLEGETLAKEKARLEAQAAAKVVAETKKLAKIQAKEEVQAKAAQEENAKAAAKKDAKLKLETEKQVKVKAKAAAQAALKAKAEAARLAKSDAKAIKEAKLAAKEKAKAVALVSKKAESAAKELAQTRAIAKAELKEKAREKAQEKALLKAQKRSKSWENIKKISEQKVKYLFHALAKAIERIRSYARHIALIYSKINLRYFARITYGTVIIGVVVLMTQVFMDRYPQTSNPDIVYELPIDPEFTVIESPEYVGMGEVQAPLVSEENLTVSVTSSVAVVAPPKQKSLSQPDPIATESEVGLLAERIVESAVEPTMAPLATSVAMLANWQINAVESEIPAGYPRLVVVIDDIGMSTAVSQKLARLPAPLTLAFLPYATRLGYQSRLVASYGHELLVHMPMAPKSLTVNPGKNALLDDLDKVEFERRLNWNLSRFTGFIGINNHMGSSLTEHTKEMQWVMAELKSRGLVFLDSVTTSDSVAASQAQLAGVPTLSRNVFLDNNRDPAAILKQLKRALLMSQRRGLSIAIGHPYPETIAVLKEWLPKLNSQGIILTPLSAAISEKYFPKTILAAKEMPSLARAK